MKPVRSNPAITLCIPVILAGITLVSGAGNAAPADGGISRRTLRHARTAIDEGRWNESFEIYEQVVQAPPPGEPELLNEALMNTTLILLSASPGEHEAAMARERLAQLAGRRGHGKELEVAALRNLLTALEEQDSANNELTEALTRERLAMEAAREHAAQMTAQHDEDLKQLRKGNKVLRRRNKRQLGELEALQQEMASREAQLAQCDGDIRFLTSQLEGSHQDQTRMLAAVIDKNEELRKKERQLQAMRVALDRKESELGEQASELRDREAELQLREEAIREVTERIMAKDESDP